MIRIDIRMFQIKIRVIRMHSDYSDRFLNRDSIQEFCPLIKHYASLNL